MFSSKRKNAMYHGDMTDVLVKAALRKVGVPYTEHIYKIATQYVTEIDDVYNTHPNVVFTTLIDKLQCETGKDAKESV